MIVYLGIDWSQDEHGACFLNEKGANIITSLTTPHSIEGLHKLDNARQKLGVSPAECWVGLETAHNLVIDYPVGNVKGTLARPVQVYHSSWK